MAGVKGSVGCDGCRAAAVITKLGYLTFKLRL